MKTLLKVAVLLLAPISAYGQSFLGPHTSNFDPLKMVYFNPAGMANSEMRWQVNILSFDVRGSNDFISLNGLKGIVRDGEFDRFKYFSENFNGEPVYIQADVDARGPGFMFAFGKNAIAFSTRSRAIASINDLDETFASSLFRYKDQLIQYLPSFADERISAGLNAYNEIGIAYSRSILDKNGHKLSAGVNVKLLNKVFFAGFTGNGITFNKIFTEGDSLINVGASQFEMAVSNDLQDKEFKYRFGIDGVAFDFGVEYSLNPKGLGDGYRLKIGAAVNDFGTLKQQYGNSSRFFVGNGQNVPIASLITSDGEMRNFNEVLDSLGTRTTPEGKMDIRLPSVMHLYADVRIVSNLFIFAGLQLNPYSFKNVDRLASLPTRYQIIPRFEMKKIGIFAPLSWDKFEGFSNGAGIRVGQFSMGSSNIISSVLKKNFTAFDFFLSMSFGGKRRTEAI